MDIIFRLRFLFWVLVLGLWGMMFREFYFDTPLEVPKIQRVHNPYRSFRSSVASIPNAPPAAMSMQDHRLPAKAEPFLPPNIERLSDDEDRPEAPPAPIPPRRRAALPPVRPAAVKAPRPSESPEPIAPREFKAPPAKTPPVAAKPEPAKPDAPFVARSGPKGFHTYETRHFIVHDQAQPDAAFATNMETLHTNLMFDLAAFSSWAQEEKVEIYLFDDQKAYQKFTGRPSWSGGASSLSRRSVYAYKSDELMGILAHELCHIYFDGFFGERSSPLWLSEGLATLVQAERGFSPPNWLTPNVDMLIDGEGFPIEKLVRVNTTSGADDDAVRLWYAQSYSVVRFLLRMQRGPSFLHMCRLLREGKALNQAVLAAYGMPFNRLRALEHAWRYDLETHRLTSRLPSEAIR